MNNPDVSRIFFDELKKLSSKVKNETMVLLRTVNCHIDVDMNIKLDGLENMDVIYIIAVYIDSDDITINYAQSENYSESEFMSFQSLSIKQQIRLYMILWSLIDKKKNKISLA